LVPESLLKTLPQVLEARQALQEKGLFVSIRDASLGGQFPVMNVTLFDQNTGQCFASFGAHPIFEVALERTLTESLQGRSLDLLEGFQLPVFDPALVAAAENIENHFIDSSGLIHAHFVSHDADFEYVPWNFEGDTAAQWQMLVNEAAAACNCTLDQELESYLVFLLMRYSTRPDMANSVLALEYLQAMQSQGALKEDQLRDLGDQCLLYSGLFPKRASRRLVKIRYYVDLGRSSYQQLYDSLQRGYTGVFDRLSTYFVALMDILQAMRDLDGRTTLDALTLHELWDDCGSERARQLLQKDYGQLALRKAFRSNNH